MPVRQIHSARRDTLRRGGFTLLEVAIALVIFVFGALAMIRIFPPALGIIQNSGDQLSAVNFNRTLLARNSKSAEPAPDAVYDPAALASTDTFYGAVAGSARRNLSIPVTTVTNPENDIQPTSLIHFKNIVGERHTVPSTGVVFTQFPYSGTPSIYQEDTLSGVKLTQVTVSANVTGVLDFSAATLDSTGAAYSYASGDKIYVSYRYTANSRLWGVNEELVSGNPISTPYTVSQYTPASGLVTVRLRRISTLASTLTSPQLGLISLTSSAVGQKLSIDYTVTDWRWLVSDAVPAGNPDDDTAVTHKIVKLPVGPLDRDQSPFLYSYFPSATADMRSSNDISNSLVAVNEKNGQVTFDTAKYPTTRTSSNVRVVYRTLDNWANQLSVAARYYNLTTATSAEKWRDFALNGSPTSNDGYLYFKPSEAGKTIRASYTYTGSPSDNTIEGRILTIDQDQIAAPASLSAFAVGGQVARVQLTDSLGNGLSSVLSIQKVEGISIQSRTAWINGDRFTQVLTTAFRGASN